jgi:hypothetical protein
MYTGDIVSITTLKGFPLIENFPVMESDVQTVRNSCAAFEDDRNDLFRFGIAIE